MNWFTKRYLKNLDEKERLVKEWGGCEHVEVDPSCAHVCSYENDSFGSEGYVSCKACFEAAQEAEADEEVVCNDCKKLVKKKDAIEWRPYDFYAPQGDEPLIICNDCKSADHHVMRVRRDTEDAEAEGY